MRSVRRSASSNGGSLFSGSFQAQTEKQDKKEKEKEEDEDKK